MAKPMVACMASLRASLRAGPAAAPLAAPLVARRPARSLAARVASRPVVPSAWWAGGATLSVDLVRRARDDRRAPVSGT